MDESVQLPDNIFVDESLQTRNPIAIYKLIFCNSKNLTVGT